MKKILLIASVLFSAVLGFTACSSDDDEYSNYNLSSDCGAAVAKTYNGTWRITSDPDKSTLVEPNWLCQKCQLLKWIDKEMKKRNTYQGLNL